MNHDYGGIFMCIYYYACPWCYYNWLEQWGSGEIAEELIPDLLFELIPDIFLELHPDFILEL